MPVYCDYDAYIITILLVIVTCDDETGTISHTPVNCYNDNSCTIDSCDEQTGNCLHETIDCDNDACTVDSFCTEFGCNYATVTCNDLPCHTTSWDTTNGCEYTPVVCDVMIFSRWIVVILTPIMMETPALMISV